MANHVNDVIVTTFRSNITNEMWKKIATKGLIGTNMIPNPESNLSDQLTKSHLHTTRDADVATLTQREGQIALRLKGAALIHSDQVDGNGASILKYIRMKLL